jgi:hypothetical protein
VSAAAGSPASCWAWPRCARCSAAAPPNPSLAADSAACAWCRAGLVLAAIGGAFAGRLFVALGAVSAILILAGVLSPLDLPVIDLANFAGYVLWSAWLVIFAVVLVVRNRRRAAGPVESASAVR